MQKEVRLTDEQWSLVMRCLQLASETPKIQSEMDNIQQRILTQLRCQESCQTMAPACPEGGRHGTQSC